MRETLIYLSHLDHDDTEKQVCESESTGPFVVFPGNPIILFGGSFLPVWIVIVVKFILFQTWSSFLFVIVKPAYQFSCISISMT